MTDSAAAPQGYPWSVAKRFLVLFLVAAALLAGTAVTHYSVAMRTERIERETSELLNVELGKTAIARDLENVTSDLMFLARHNWLTKVGGEWKMIGGATRQEPRKIGKKLELHPFF
jgi:hypothetical protein